MTAASGAIVGPQRLASDRVVGIRRHRRKHAEGGNGQKALEVFEVHDVHQVTVSHTTLKKACIAMHGAS
jgi:hypothetical protein